MTYFVKSKRKTLALIGVLCLVLLSVKLIYLPHAAQRGVAVGMESLWLQEQTKVPIVSPDIDTAWRYTSQGWQRSDNWMGAEFTPNRAFESVHPFVWAASVLLAVVATTIWASSEWEVARLLGRD